MLQWTSWIETARFHSPLRNGALEEQTIEVRRDPLTGHQSIYNPALEGKTSILFPPTDEAYLKERAAASAAACFLCDGKWRTMTPTYPEELIPGGRLIKGESVLFPNLFPLGAYHAVVMVGSRHHRRLDDFPEALLQDALSLAVDFVRRCRAQTPEIRYFTINANYLFPAGASVTHPHLQILGGVEPGTHHRLLLDASKAYKERTGTRYWDDLTASEQATAQRFIAEIDGTHWMAAYSPMGVNEILAVYPHAADFLAWTEREIAATAVGLRNVLRGYHALGFSTFNFSCYSGPLGADDGSFACVLRMVNRQNVTPHYRTDDYYFQKLLKNEIMILRPEKLAELMRAHFM
jgi:galactose-1-phosphate uridylyltransferase